MAPADKGARGPDGARGPGRDHGPGGERFGKGGPLGHMLDGLSLTDAQRASIDSALAAQRPAAPDHEAMKKKFEAMGVEMRARMESFASDSFDAKAFLAPPADAPQGRMMNPLARMVNELAVVVPLLDATQRETLAAQLEKGRPRLPAVVIAERAAPPIADRDVEHRDREGAVMSLTQPGAAPRRSRRRARRFPQAIKPFGALGSSTMVPSEERVTSIVYVEDDEKLARLTARYLESHGVRVTLAFDAREGSPPSCASGRT